MAPGTIRMSGDEKRVKILELFHESKDFFTLKEVEKGASKKGVVEKTVKEILQMMVADGIVQSDKIGISNFFWSFPSARGATLRNQLKIAQEEKGNHEARIKELEETIVSDQALRVDTEERRSALQEFQKLQEELATLKAELAQYGQCDPEQLAQKQRATFLAHEAAQRWTENVLIARDYLVRQYSVGVDEFNQHFGIKIDFEEVE